MRVQNKKEKKECSDGGDFFFLREGALYGDGFCVVTASALNGKSGRVTFSSGEKNLCWAAKRKRKISLILSE